MVWRQPLLFPVAPRRRIAHQPVVETAARRLQTNSLCSRHYWSGAQAWNINRA